MMQLMRRNVDKMFVLRCKSYSYKYRQSIERIINDPYVNSSVVDNMIDMLRTLDYKLSEDNLVRDVLYDEVARECIINKICKSCFEDGMNIKVMSCSNPSGSSCHYFASICYVLLNQLCNIDCRLVIGTNMSRYTILTTHCWVEYNGMILDNCQNQDGKHFPILVYAEDSWNMVDKDGNSICSIELL